MGVYRSVAEGQNGKFRSHPISKDERVVHFEEGDSDDRKPNVQKDITCLSVGTPGERAAIACTGSACPCETMEQALTRMFALEAQETNSQTDFLNPQLLGDQEFVREALEDGSAEVLLGQLA